MKAAKTTTDPDLVRMEDKVRARLFALGVPSAPQDSTADLVRIVEAIERFESVVSMKGGDLMVDEPPPGRRPQPDRPELLLPARGAGEPASLYIQRVTRATELAAASEDRDL